MTRTIGANLTTHIAGTAHTRCKMLRLDLVDGTIFAFTDHNQDLTYDLGDGVATYSAGAGIIPSNLSLSTGFDVDDIEIRGPITEAITRTMILGGRFEDATSRLFQANWDNLADGEIAFLRGFVAQSGIEAGEFRLTIHSETSKFQQNIGRVITAYCDADFGDARCGFTPGTLAATVSAVTDDRTFTVTFTGSYANDYWNRGTVTFLTGALAGTRPVEVFDWTSGGAVTLWTGLAEAPTIGDTLTLTQGCGKTRADCLVYGNVINFRGFPDVPGSDQVLKYPNPGSA